MMFMKRGATSLISRGLRTNNYLSTASKESNVSSVKSFDEIPHPRGLPIVKNLLDAFNTDHFYNLGKYHIFLRDCYGDIFKLRMPGKNKDVLFVCNPEMFRTLLKNDGEMPRNPVFEFVEHIRTRVLTDRFPVPGLAVVHGPAWLSFRQAVQQDMLKPGVAEFHIEELDDVMEKFLDANLRGKLDEEGRCTLHNIPMFTQELAMGNTVVMFLGQKFKSWEEDEWRLTLLNANNLFNEVLVQVAYTPFFIARWTNKYQQGIEASRIIIDLAIKAIDNFKRDLQQDDQLYNTVLGQLIKRNGMDSPIPFIMAGDSMLAGADTTGSAMAFFLYNLANNQDKQEKVYQEIVKVVGREGKMTRENLKAMRYLRAAVVENHRNHPVTPGSGRLTAREMVLGGYNIPKGTKCFFNFGMTAKDPRFFPDPHKFIPERFLRGDPLESKHDPFAFIPFGHGPRSCIGQRFINLEQYMLGLKILQEYRLETDDQPVGVNYMRVGHPDRDFPITFIRRT